MINIDGSIGEGGGQVLRVCLALSALTGESVAIKNVRVNRANPGLRPQHLTAIRALAEVANAKTSGLDLGSSEVTFVPGRMRGGIYSFDAKTAGSTTLILQALLPVLAFVDQPSSVTLIGGTNNPLAPQVDYVINVLNPVLASMGFFYELRLIKRGFYPRGGGVLKVVVTPVERLTAINVISMGSLRDIKGISHSRNLQAHVAERQAEAATQSCARAGYPNVSIERDSDQKEENPSTGSGIVLWAETSTGGRLAGDALGARGKPAELVGREGAGRLLTQLSKGAPFDVHLGDQLVIWLALAEGRSRIAISKLTLHTVTALKVTEMLAGCRFKISGEVGGPGVIDCAGGITPR
ncbi:MAG: RNA 3'-terminal phosphate cyclase [Halobacteriota archaeon]